MAELADALGSGPSSRKGVEVRVLFRAPTLLSFLTLRQPPLAQKLTYSLLRTTFLLRCAVDSARKISLMTPPCSLALHCVHFSQFSSSPLRSHFTPTNGSPATLLSHPAASYFSACLPLPPTFSSRAPPILLIRPLGSRASNPGAPTAAVIYAMTTSNTAAPISPGPSAFFPRSNCSFGTALSTILNPASTPSIASSLKPRAAWGPSTPSCFGTTIQTSALTIVINSICCAIFPAVSPHSKKLSPISTAIT